MLNDAHHGLMLEVPSRTVSEVQNQGDYNHNLIGKCCHLGDQGWQRTNFRLSYPGLSLLSPSFLSSSLSFSNFATLSITPLNDSVDTGSQFRSIVHFPSPQSGHLSPLCPVKKTLPQSEHIVFRISERSSRFSSQVKSS